MGGVYASDSSLPKWEWLLIWILVLSSNLCSTITARYMEITIKYAAKIAKYPVRRRTKKDRTIPALENAQGSNKNPRLDAN